MRRGNENAILAALREEPDQSGSVLARRTGLAPQTVSVLLRHLEAAGLITRGAALRGRRGQPAVPFRLRGEAAYAVGVELGWQHCDFVLLDLSGRIVRGARRFFPWPDPDRIVADLVSGIEAVSGGPERRNLRIAGIGLTVPAGLAERAFVIGAPDEVGQRLRGIDVVGALAAHFRLPVETTNDGTAALWAETSFGRVPRRTDSAYVFLSTFIGGALNVDGRVLKGRDDGAGRIGAAMTTLPDGHAGALHFTSSLWALSRFLARLGYDAPAHAVDAWDWDALEPGFARWLEQAADALALAFANTAAIVGVPVVIMDSILPRPVLARLINAIQARINALPIEVFEPPRLLIGQCGPSAPAIGAAYQVFHARYFALETGAAQRGSEGTNP